LYTQAFDEFYPYYLCEHVQPRTKLFHFLATFNELALLTHMLLLSKEGFKITTLLLILLQVFFLQHQIYDGTVNAYEHVPLGL